MMKRLAAMLLLAASATAAPACHKSQASPPEQGAKVPAGEVWLAEQGLLHEPIPVSDEPF